MPRVKLAKMVTSNPVNSSPSQQPAIVAPIVPDSAPAIDTSIPVTIQPVKEYLRLAGTSFLVDPDTGAIYLNPTILKAMKNS